MAAVYHGCGAAATASALSQCNRNDRRPRIVDERSMAPIGENTYRFDPAVHHQTPAVAPPASPWRGWTGTVGTA